MVLQGEDFARAWKAVLIKEPIFLPSAFRGGYVEICQVAFWWQDEDFQPKDEQNHPLGGIREFDEPFEFFTLKEVESLIDKAKQEGKTAFPIFMRAAAWEKHGIKSKYPISQLPSGSAFETFIKLAKTEGS